LGCCIAVVFKNLRTDGSEFTKIVQSFVQNKRCAFFHMVSIFFFVLKSKTIGLKSLTLIGPIITGRVKFRIDDILARCSYSYSNVKTKPITRYIIMYLYIKSIVVFLNLFSGCCFLHASIRNTMLRIIHIIMSTWLYIL